MFEPENPTLIPRADVSEADFSIGDATADVISAIAADTPELEAEIDALQRLLHALTSSGKFSPAELASAAASAFDDELCSELDDRALLTEGDNVNIFIARHR